MTVLEHEDINFMSKEELDSYEKREKTYYMSRTTEYTVERKLTEFLKII